ncbi:EscT/YscT/HrcT family type III secretion system export apparatus protein [Chlamydiifrater volucris]|uniref:EscT/YscT/HrcT family type III secretion system export apparatus protein n=1 Tax=Chlamydiifrater volucris TaxID=2681470 RepID=UPI001BCE3879|nr:EscT/YscT/HrcT family type III secretion system export apparatus protein [Chlamydiifrater volucris]
MSMTLPDLALALKSEYLDYIFQFPAQHVWCVFLLLLARLLPIFGIVPFLGGKLFPSPIKIGIAISWLALLFPKLLAETGRVDLFENSIFYVLLVKEVFLGSVMALVLSFPFYAAQSAGSFVSNQQGIQGLEGATSLISIEQTSPQGILYHYIVTITFWLVGGYRIVIDLLLHSLQVLPLEQFLPKDILMPDSPLWVTLIKMAQLCLIMTIQLSAPSTLAMLMSDLFLGIINRMAPQVQVIYLLSALKAFMGMLFLCISWWFIVKQIDLFTLAWFKKIPAMIFGSPISSI